MSNTVVTPPNAAAAVPRREVLLVRIAGIAEMHMHVDRAGQHVQAGSVERLARGRHRLVGADRDDVAVLDRDARRRSTASGRDDLAAADDEIGCRSSCRSSQHGPAAVDRQVDAGDLARHVAREEQAGIGDVAVGA